MPRSLSGRLLAGSAVATVLALALVLLLMNQVLRRFVTGQIDQRLDNKIVALASQARAAQDGMLTLDGDADGPPFDKRLHRSFWIVQGPRNVLRTRWLSAAEPVAPAAPTLARAFTGPAPPPPGPGGLATHPRSLDGETLDGVVLHERVARTTIGDIPVTILVAAPAEAIDGPIREAMGTVGLGVLALGVALGALALAQVRLGLRPLVALRAQIAEVGDGRRARLSSEQPREIAPLVSEMNLLLERNAANLEKARRHVANLAHGLKTPLATLGLAVERMDVPAGRELRALLADIDVRVRHHLGRARAGALAGPERARCRLAPRLDDLGEALTRIHAERRVALIFEGDADLDLACEASDLDEILGNLLDNAFKFARTRVICATRREDRWARLSITDDGPGLGADQIALVLQPGQRLDEQVPGFGFGLAIAGELVELYGGALRLEPGTPGLAATVTLPLAGK